MIKKLALILIVSGISSSGAFISASFSKKCRVRKETAQLLNSIENGVKYSALPLDVIVKRFLKDNPKAKKIELLAKNSDDIYEYDASGILDKNERDTVNDFFCSFGKAKCRQAQLEELKLFITEYGEMRKTADEKCKVKSILYSRLGIIFGLAFALILI